MSLAWLTAALFVVDCRGVVEDGMFPFTFQKVIPGRVRDLWFPVRTLATADLDPLAGGPQTVLWVERPGVKFDVVSKAFVEDTADSTRQLYWVYLMRGLGNPLRAFVVDALPTFGTLSAGALSITSAQNATFIQEVVGYINTPPSLARLDLRYTPGPLFIDLSAPEGLSLSSLDSDVAAREGAAFRIGRRDRKTLLAATTKADARCGGRTSMRVPWAASYAANRPQAFSTGRLKFLASFEHLVLVKPPSPSLSSPTFLRGGAEPQPAMDATPVVEGTRPRWRSLMDGVPSESPLNETGGDPEGEPFQSTFKPVTCVFASLAHGEYGGAGSAARSAVWLSPHAGDVGLVDGHVRMSYAFSRSAVGGAIYVATQQRDASWVWEEVSLGGGSIGVIDVGGRRSLWSSSASSLYREREMEVPGRTQEFSSAQLLLHEVPQISLSVAVTVEDLGKPLTLRWGEGGGYPAGVVKHTVHNLGVHRVVYISFLLRLAPTLDGVVSGWVDGGSDYRGIPTDVHVRSALHFVKVNKYVVQQGACYGTGWAQPQDGTGFCVFDENRTFTWTLVSDPNGVVVVPADAEGAVGVIDLLGLAPSTRGTVYSVNLNGAEVLDVPEGGSYLALGVRTSYQSQPPGVVYFFDNANMKWWLYGFILFLVVVVLGMGVCTWAFHKKNLKATPSGSVPVRVEHLRGACSSGRCAHGVVSTLQCPPRA